MSEIIPIITFSSTNSIGLESVASKDITVTLSEASNNAVSIDYALTGTATGSGTDYNLANGTLTIVAGQTSGTITIADIVDDNLVEGNETVTVTLSNPTNGVLGSGVSTIVSNGLSFAALKYDGSVVTWGYHEWGGDSSAVDLKDINTIVGSLYSFAALTDDGSVITWGHSDYGGDSSSVAGDLSGGVSSIVSNEWAYAAIKENGSVVTWGDSDYGGNSSSVTSNLLSGVSSVVGNDYSFAALKTDGSVVTWGDSTFGADSSSVASNLSSGVSSIVSGGFAFAAIKENGSVVTWGYSDFGGNSSSVSSDLSSNVSSVASNDLSFAAIKADGSVVTWGHSSYGGDSSSVNLANDVSAIEGSERAFAALKSDGSVVTWGDSDYGGDSSSVSSELSSGVSILVSSNQAFAALKSDGSVVTWGDSNYGGDSSSVSSDLSSGVSSISSNGHAFAALKTDGSVVTWGDPDKGGNSLSVESDLSSSVSSIGGDETLVSNGHAFAALKTDGSVVTWGNPEYGGEPKIAALAQSVADDLTEKTTHTYTIENNDVPNVNISDTSGDDIVTGTAYADTISAGIGRDVLDALGDDDTITLIGNSYFDGLTAHNVSSTTDVATNVKLDLTGKVKLETVVDGGADADTINLGSSSDAFFLHDSFSGFHSSLTLTTDTHTGAQGTQRIMNVENINGLGGDDIIDLTSPDYSLAGQVITINGGAGSDVIWGSDATETLKGGAGNDIIFGGSGNDTLTGGSGADTFEFTRTAGSDMITDFQSGSDSIKLYSDYTFNVSKTDSSTSDYSIDDQSDPTLYLVRGKTYTFEMSGNGHPFYIKSTDATSGTSDEYIDGVTRIGSANSGSDGDKLQFIAGAETPDTLWYQCSAHSGMLGQINVVDKLSDTLQTNGNNLIWNTLTIQSDTAIELDDVSFVAIA